MTLEILIPVRNPTEVFGQTIDSLVAQTDQRFSVLISDNHSSKGGEQMESALQKLTAAGIPARKVQPPAELGRVEHWNWLHEQSKTDWLKPLFAGDWLEPVYIERVRNVVAANPSCRYVFASGFTHLPGQPPLPVTTPWTGHYRSPREMQDVVLRYGMQFGPPSAAAYEREAFFLAGGYEPELPITADSYLFCKMAALFGAVGISERLFHFCIHAARFSTGLPQKRRETFRETLKYYFRLRGDVRRMGGRVPAFGFFRLLVRETRGYLFRRS